MGLEPLNLVRFVAFLWETVGRLQINSSTFRNLVSSITGQIVSEGDPIRLDS
jgi:hypothetical protein